jgi:hypothetical protein
MSAHEHHHAPTPADGVKAGHELTDAEAAPVLKFLVFLGAVTITLAGIVVFFYNYLESREAREKTARYPMAASAARPLPPPPRLQTYPFQDVKDLRQEERRLLETYEWVDKSAGVVRIPVERAIEVLAEKGLPYRQPGTTAPAASAPASGTAAPTGTASGNPPVSAPSAAPGHAAPAPPPQH